MCYACHPGHVPRCLEPAAGQWPNTVISLVCECIRALSLAHCSPSCCWKRPHVSSALVRHGSFSMLMTWWSSQTPGRSVSPSLRHERLAWKVKVMKKTKFMVSGFDLDVLKEIRRVSMCCLLQRCWQQLHRVLAVGPQEVPRHRSWTGGQLKLHLPQVLQWVSANQWQTNDPSGRWRHRAWCGGHFLLSVWHAVIWWGCDSAIATRCCVAWGKFRKLLRPSQWAPEMVWKCTACHVLCQIYHRLPASQPQSERKP